MPTLPKYFEPDQVYQLPLNQGYKCNDCGQHSEFDRRSLCWLLRAIAGFGGLFGLFYSRHYDDSSGYGLALLTGVTNGFIAIIVQFLFFRLRPKIDEAPSFPWDNTDPPKIEISHPLAYEPAVKIKEANKTLGQPAIMSLVESELVLAADGLEVPVIDNQ